MKKPSIILLSILTTSIGFSQKKEKSELWKKAKEIHEKIITIDTHDDIDIANFTAENNYTQDLNTQVNLPKMEEGCLDVAWFIVYTGQGELNENGYAKAYENAISKFEAIHRLTEEIAPDKIGLATTSAEVRELVNEGKLVAMIGVENAYPIGQDLSKIKEFYDRGARYMSLAHNGHSQLSDSNSGEAANYWLHNGLSELGKQAVVEMNRLGIMIDVSHPSKEAIKQMFELSKAPLIASHSSARGLSDHSRNLDDELLELFKEHGGVVQTVAFSTYVNTSKNARYYSAQDKIYAEQAEVSGFKLLSRDSIRSLEKDLRTEYNTEYQKIVAASASKVNALRKTITPVNVSDYVDHIDYLVEKIGIDHVGISSDFDGGGGVEGWRNASESFNVTLELVKRGYSEVEIAKLWGENLLRVLDEVQAVAAKIQKG